MTANICLEGELMFELYEDKAEWDSLQGEALLIEDESIVVEPTGTPCRTQIKPLL